MPRHFLFTLVALAGACTHTDLATSSAEGSAGPFVISEPLRLTYGGGTTPQWSGRPGEIAYAFPRDRHPDGTFAWCVGGLPVGGGSRSEEFCDTDPAASDTSILVTEWPARSDDGLVLFARHRVNRFGVEYGRGLTLRDTRAGTANVQVVPVPFFAGGKVQAGISHPAWVDHDHLVLIGRGVVRSSLDNVNSGQEIFTFAPAEGPDGFSSVPGTTWASSLDLSPDHDTLYYTLGGDSLIYRRILSTGVIDTVFDFGGLGIARDVRVRNGRLVAVVGGDVTWGPHETLGMAQYDDGGPIYSVDLPAGAPVLVTESYDRYRHPVLSSDGKYVVAEQFNDLWRRALP